MENERPKRFSHELFAFEGRGKKEIVNCISITMGEFDSVKKLFPKIVLIDELRRLYKYASISYREYSKFVKKTKHDTRKTDSIVMQKMIWGYEAVLIDYLLKSSVLINNIRTYDRALIDGEYQIDEFRFVITLRNLLEHNQIPLSGITYRRSYHRSAKSGKMKENNTFIASAGKDTLLNFVNQKKNKKYISENERAINSMPVTKNGDVVIESVKYLV